MSPSASPAAPAKEPAKRPSLGHFVEKWIVWRATSFALWYWVLGAFIQHASGVDKLACKGWIALAPGLALVFFAARQQWIKLAGFPFYVVSFPLVFFGLVFWFCFRVVSAQWRIFWISTSDLAAVVCFFLLLGSWVCIDTITLNDRLSAAITTDVILVMLLIVWALRWASDPLRPIRSALTGIGKLGSKLIDLFYMRPLLAGRDQQKVKSALSVLSSAEQAVTVTLRGVEQTMRRTLIPLTAVGFLSIFTVVVTGFAFAVFGGQRLTESAFTGLPSSVSFSMCWLYSLTAITVSPVDGVHPATDFGYNLFTAELVSAVLLLTVFFSMFSMAIELHSEQRIAEFKTQLQRAIEWLTQRRKEVTGSEVDVTASTSIVPQVGRA